MLKDAGYQEKIEMLSFWLEEIVETVKKDLKQEHLKIDRAFCKKYFLGKNPNQVTAKEMAEAYKEDIAGGNIGLGEFIATRWLLRNTDVYGFFEDKLKTVSADFETLDELPSDYSAALIQGSLKKFGAKKTYLFSVLNSVVFPGNFYQELKEQAVKETEKQLEEQEAQESIQTLEACKAKYQRELAALKDRYEAKLSGLQKKYLRDMEMLKKQVGTLQKKLAEKC